MSSSLAALGLMALPASAGPSKPHVLFIVADDYGNNDIEYNQNTKTPFNPDGKLTTPTDQVIKTPQIDKLAKEGVTLQNYYVQQVCSPTRATIVSGRYSSHTGIGPDVIRPDAPYGLPLDETTIAEVMKDAGYRTTAIGKWHLGFCSANYTPTFRGFDSYQGYLLGAENYFKHTRSWDHVHGYDFRNSSFEAKDILPPTAKGFIGTYSAYIFTQRMIDVATHHAAAYPTTPLFTYLPFQSVHSPLQVPPQYETPYSHITDHKRKKYAGMVSAMDEAVGKVVQGYKNAGMWQDTVTIFTTDNGGQVDAGGNNFPLRGWKGSNYEGGLRGVGWVRGTDSALAPLPIGTNMAQMHSTDWLPTVAAIAGVTNPKTNKPLDGFNAWPALQGKVNATERAYIVHNCPKNGDGLGGAFRMGDYKLMYVSADGTTAAQQHMCVEATKRQVPPPGLTDSSLLCDPPQPAYKVSVTGVDIPASQGVFLFNIASDPYECVNLAGDGEHSKQLAALVTEFYKYQTQTETVRDGRLLYNSSAGANPANLPDDAWGPFLHGCQ